MIAAAPMLASNSHNADAADLAVRFGIVDADDQSTLTLTVADDSLQRGDRVAIVRVPSGTIVCCATVDRILVPAEGEIDPVQFDGEMTKTRYALDPGGIGDEAGFGFGIVSAPPDLVSGDALRLDINGDGRIEHFGSCASVEGLHLTVTSGEPPEALRIWHAYYYLGYDTEADCPPENGK